MQVKKPLVQQRIMDVAREEFLLCGFHGATMRSIAKESSASLGNLYTYFADKDDLFLALVQTTVDTLDRSLEAASLLEPSPDFPLPPLSWLEDNPAPLIHFIEEHLENLKLVFLLAEGSSLTQYPEELAQRATDIFLQHLDTWESTTNSPAPTSGFFLHALATFFVTSLVEMLKHELDLDSIEGFVKDTVAFVNAGFRNFLPPKTPA